MNFTPHSTAVSEISPQQKALQGALTQVSKWLELMIDRNQTQMRQNGIDPARPLESVRETQRLSPAQQQALESLAHTQAQALSSVASRAATAPATLKVPSGGRTRDPLSPNPRHLRV